MNNKQIFKISKVFNDGTANPIINRMSLQFMEIIGSGFINLEIEKLDNIKKLLFECMEKLLKAEEAKNNYILIEDKVINNISSGESIEIQKNAIIFDDPTNKLKRLFEDFLINCVIAIRKVIRISEIVFELKIDGPGELRKILEKEFSNEKQALKMIDEDSEWVMELYTYRTAVEHEELAMIPFRVNIFNKKDIQIAIPKIPSNKATVREYVKVTLGNCFTFCEDLIFLLLRRISSSSVDIISIPEMKRKEYRDFKYILVSKGVKK